MATVELAVAMPSVVLVLGLGLTALTAGADQVRCIDAARATARLAARGEPGPAATAVGRRLAPEGAEIEVSRGPAEVTVVVSGPPAAGLRWVGVAFRPTATAVAAREDALTVGLP